MILTPETEPSRWNAIRHLRSDKLQAIVRRADHAVPRGLNRDAQALLPRKAHSCCDICRGAHRDYHSRMLLDR